MRARQVRQAGEIHPHTPQQHVDKEQTRGGQNQFRPDRLHASRLGQVVAEGVEPKQFVQPRMMLIGNQCARFVGSVRG